MCKREEYALAASDSVLLYETSNEQAYCFTVYLKVWILNYWVFKGMETELQELNCG